MGLKVDTSFNNFSRANIDHDMMGRYDLPIYQSGADLVQNFITNFKGNAIYRSGFEDMVLFQNCVLIEFKFNPQQQYLCLFYANKIRFMAYDSGGNFGWVLDNSLAILEVATPYSLAQCGQIQYTQNSDVMVVTHNDFAPFKLTRLSANSFSFGTFARTADPFINLEAVKTIAAVTQANPAVVTITSHGYVTGDKVFITAISGMDQLNDHVYSVVTLTTSTFQLVGINSTGFDAYISGGTAQKLKSTAITAITNANPAVVTSAAHTLSSGDQVTIYNGNGMTQVNGNTYTVDKISSAQFSLRGVDSTGFGVFTTSASARVRELEEYPACCLFYKGRLYYANTKIRRTTIFASTAGQYDNFTLTPITDTVALIFTIADISTPIEWLFPGDNSLIVGSSSGICAVNGGSVNAAITASTVDSTLTSAPPCNGAYPFKKDGLIFYAGTDGRNIYYFNYDILQEQFIAKDANLLSYDISLGGILKMRWKKDRNDLIFCTTGSVSGDLLTCNFNGTENIIGWSQHATNGAFMDEAVITDQNGVAQFFALTFRNGNYYIERQAPYVEFVKRVGFFSGKDNKRIDDIAYNRYIAEQLKNCNYLDNSMMVENLQANTITFSGGNTITATNNVFAPGDVGKHIVYQTMTGYESGRFEIAGYTSAKIVTVNVLQVPTSNVYTSWYLTFSTITGLSNYNGQTISAVTDGGYLSDFTVSGGQIDLGKQVTSAWVGYKYTGVIKSFSLGFQIQGLTTQETMKAICLFGVRCVSSAGLEVGSSLYHLEAVQELTQDDINYLPPIPIDGTKYVQFTDDHERDKFFYIVQEDPLPATIASVIVGASYTVQT